MDTRIHGPLYAMGLIGITLRIVDFHIPRYLKKQKYPDDFISNAKVTHVWSQSRELSEQIAKASKIEFVVDKIEEMIDSVDGILLARDDAQNHLKFAKPFLDAGMPSTDKPLALSVKEANKFRPSKYQGRYFHVVPEVFEFYFSRSSRNSGVLELFAQCSGLRQKIGINTQCILRSTTSNTTRQR